MCANVHKLYTPSMTTLDTLLGNWVHFPSSFQVAHRQYSNLCTTWIRKCIREFPSCARRTFVLCRKKERKNEKWLFFEHLVLTCTIVLMNDLGLVRCIICWRFWFWHLDISQSYRFWVIWVFVMYYIYGISIPSLLIESTDSMISLIIISWSVNAFSTNAVPYALHILVWMHVTVVFNNRYPLHMHSTLRPDKGYTCIHHNNYYYAVQQINYRRCWLL